MNSIRYNNKRVPEVSLPFPKLSSLILEILNYFYYYKWIKCQISVKNYNAKLAIGQRAFIYFNNLGLELKYI